MFLLRRNHHPPSIPSSTTATATPSKLKSKICLLLPQLASFATFTSIVFLILVIIGNTYNTRSLTKMYFLQIDVSNIIPRTYPNAALVNTIAQTLGLRDFYQVGLWNYCEGYKGRGVTYCSEPKALYSFNPVEILMSQLLAGATIAMPAEVTNALEIAKKASHWMFAAYFVGILFSFFSFLLGLTPRIPRPLHLTVAIIATFFTVLASAISTALFVIFRSVFEDRPDFNIHGNLGKEIFAFMWLASAFSLFSTTVWISFGCRDCRRRRRDRKTAKKSVEEGDVGEGTDGRSMGSSTQVEQEKVRDEERQNERESADRERDRERERESEGVVVSGSNSDRGSLPVVRRAGGPVGEASEQAH